MNFNGIVINTRTRNPWQAINLGVLIARAWYWPLFLSWIIPCAAVTILLALAFPSFASWLPITVAWWLKPLWDRGPLFMASRRLFNEPTGVMETLRELPKLYIKDSLMALTLRRLSPSRSYDLPVTCLEGLKGKTRRARIDVLHRAGSNEATWTMLLLFHLEMILVIAGASLVFLFVPDGYAGEALQFFKHEIAIGFFIYNVLYFLGMALIAPFYTVCGFSQYINRRIELEGWGIELQFRQLVENHEHQSAKKGTSNRVSTIASGVGLFLMVGVCLLAQPRMVYADDGNSEESKVEQLESDEKEQLQPDDKIEDEPAQTPHLETQSQLESRAIAKEILAGGEFHQTRQKSKIRFKNAKSMEDDEVPQWLIAFIEFMERFGNKSDSDGSWFKTLATFIGTLAIGIEVIFWCVLAVIIIWVIYLYREFFQNALRIKSPTKEISHDQPEVLFGLDVRGSSLPENPLAVIRNLWDSQAYREAISLLYRATLIKLINERRMPFRSHFTEFDCFITVKNAYPDAPITDYFGKLTQQWELIAYAHRTPDAAQVEMLLAQWEAMIDHAE